MSRVVRFLPVLLFTLCPLLFFTRLTHNPYYTQIMLLQAIVLVYWGARLAAGAKERTLSFAITPVHVPMAAFLAVCAFSAAFSWWSHVPYREPILSEAGKRLIFILVNVALVYQWAVDAEADRQGFRWIRWSYGISAIAGVYAILQACGVEWIWPTELNPFGRRPVSTFGNPNFLSSYLVLLLPSLAVDFWLEHRPWKRRLWGLIFAVDLWALVATMTRSSWAGAAAGLAIPLLMIIRKCAWTPENRRKLLFLAAMPLIAAALWKQPGVQGMSVLERVTEVRALQTSGGAPYAPVSQRLLIWNAALNIASDHPLLGCGMGCFELFYPSYQGVLLSQKAFAGLRTHANNCHNEILEHLSQIGWVGLGVYGWMVITLFSFGWRANRFLEEEPRLRQTALFAGLAGMWVDNLVNVSLHFATPALLAWWIAGVWIARSPGGFRRVSWDLKPRAAALAAGLAFLCFLGIGKAFANWRGEVLSYRAMSLTKQGVNLATADRLFEKAHAWRPRDVNTNYEWGNLVARLGEEARAYTVYQEALNSNPGYDEIHYNLGAVCVNLGKKEEGLRYFCQALWINPLSRSSYTPLAAHFARLGDPLSLDRGIGLLEYGLLFFPKDAELRAMRDFLQARRASLPLKGRKG